MYLESLRQDMRRWGLLKSLYVRVIRRAERYLNFRLFVVHARPLDPNAPDDPLPPGCTVRVLTVPELIEFARDPQLAMTADSIRAATARGDICFGYLEHGALVAYTWIATKATPAEAGLWVRFAPMHSYGYKALTVPSHRGRHLQEYVVHQTDRWQAARGCRYNIDHIHTTNLASIAADRRYGNRPVGYAGYFTWWGRVVPFRSPGAKARGFEFFEPAVDTVAGRSR